MSIPDDEFLISPASPGQEMRRLLGIAARLRAPGGCPWDREQTHRSLTPHLLEEAYEVMEAIHEDDPLHLREELGDLLLQTVLHARIAEEAGQFTFSQVAEEISDKLIRRHPHVFADSSVADTDGVLRQWDEIKATEKPDRPGGWLDGIGQGLPALLRAGKLSKKAAKVGFDWPDLKGVLAKMREELAEVEVALATPDNREAVAEEIGDVLFTAANLARKAGFEPETLAALANNKFATRFRKMAEALKSQGLTLDAATPEQMEAAWTSVK